MVVPDVESLQKVDLQKFKPWIQEPEHTSTYEGSAGKSKRIPFEIRAIRRGQYSGDRKLRVIQITCKIGKDNDSMEL